MIKELKPVSLIVEEILAENIDARNSDKAVILYFLERYGLRLTGEQKEAWNKCVAFESITSARRTIQNKLKKYPPNDFVVQMRKQREKAMKTDHKSVESVTGLRLL